MEQKAQKLPYKPCVDCGKSVVLGVRKGNICLDCLIIRIAEVLPPTKRKNFLKDVFQRNGSRPEAQENPPEAPKDAGPGPS